MLNSLTELALWNLWAFMGVLAAVQILVFAVGYQFARRRVAAGQTPSEGLKIVGGGILALTAFVLALTLSFASNRLQERRNDGLEEANAIGTAWLQASATGEAHGAAIAREFETYITLRRTSLTLDVKDPRIAEIADEVSALQTKIWAEVSALVSARPDPLTVSVMNSVNHAFDMTTAQIMAVGTPMPPQLTVLLLMLVLAGVFVVGFQLGFVGRPHAVLSVLLILVWTDIVVLILDFGNSRVGQFRTTTVAYDMTIAGMGLPPP